jgi:hypothetical protein
MTIALAPLDERPVNTRYPAQIAAIAGANLLLPPAAIRGQGRIPADLDGVQAWLQGIAPDIDGVVASADYLAYGNLINARISTESTAETLPRLLGLDVLGQRGTPVFAFSLITRVANANDCVEEPEYWKTWGTRLYALSQLRHQEQCGALDESGRERLAALVAELPVEHVADWLQRRLRNHTLNLALLDLLARERLTFLLLTSDDTSAFGLPSREKAWLEEWRDLLGDAVGQRLLIHPGADEVGSALVARLLCRQQGLSPRICPLYAIPGDEEIIAAYEDRAVRLTVEGQIRACGATIVSDPDDADIVLAVLTPSPRRTEFRADFAQAERTARQPFYDAFFATLGRRQAAGQPIALGDVAYPNGADPLAMALLLDPACPLDPARLASFGAWNTAGNTLGTTVAQAVARWLPGHDPAAQKIALAHHFLEGWGYQTEVRREARDRNREAWNHHDPNPDDDTQVATTCAAIERGLRIRLAALQARGIGSELILAPGSVRLPWRRTFEVDFELVPR